MARRSVGFPRTSAIPTRFSESELARMDKARNLLGLSSRSALIRDAVMEKIDAVERMGILELRDVTVEEAMRLIDRYLKKHPGTHWVSDFIEELGIEPKVAFEAVQRLIEAGRAREGRA